MSNNDFDLRKLFSAITGSAVIFIALLILVFLISGTYIVPPGHRGVRVVLGSVSPNVLPEGFGLKIPFITKIVPVSIRQNTVNFQGQCYSSDLQQININLDILYRIPEHSAVKIFQQYAGHPYDTLIEPRIAEAIKEAVAQESAEMVVKNREKIKMKTLEATSKKIGELLLINDIVINNITLSPQLEQAIEAKMVQQQEAAKAKFTQEKAQIEAKTKIITAEGEAQAIRIRGNALRANPLLIDFGIVERWDGKTPLVVGSGGKGGANVLLPLSGR